MLEELVLRTLRLLHRKNIHPEIFREYIRDGCSQDSYACQVYIPVLVSRRATNRPPNNSWPQASVAATQNSNRGTIDHGRESVMTIAYMKRWYISSTLPRRSSIDQIGIFITSVIFVTNL
jgi:hypothetical protein